MIKIAKYIIKEVIIVIFIMLVFVSSIMFFYNSNVFFKITSGLPYLETKLLYLPDELLNMVEEYGELGRNIYVKNSLALDIFIPILLSMFLVFLYIYISKKNNLKKVKIVTMFSIFYCLSDFIENSLMIYIIKIYPSVNINLAYIARVITSLKFIFIAALLILIIMQVKNMIGSYKK